MCYLKRTTANKEAGFGPYLKKLLYAEIKRSYWMFQVTSLNQSECIISAQRSYAAIKTYL